MEGHIFGETVLEIFTKEFFVKIFKPIFGLSVKFGLLVPLEAVSIKGFALFKYCESVPSLAGMSSQLQPYSTLTFSIVRSS